jgi:hypothetical protein
METIAYVKDPTNENMMTNCVLDYARFTTKTMDKMLTNRFQLYDSHDKKNDKEAVEHLLASVSTKLLFFFLARPRKDAYTTNEAKWQDRRGTS